MSEKTVLDLTDLGEPDYRGSVQELYHLTEHADRMVCKTMPGGSVFDVGTIFSIPRSDICRTALRHKIYSLLASPEEWEEINGYISREYAQDKKYLAFLSEGLLEEFRARGASTHHLGMIDRDSGQVYKDSFPPSPSQYVLVKKYQIIKPVRVSWRGNHLWDYSECYRADKYVVPLENIVRIGVTSGSSIYKNYLKLSDGSRKSYLKELGIEQEELIPWTVFAKPVVDFTTKYEPEDRSLSWQEALYISGNNGKTLLDIIKMSILGGLLVARFFNKIGLFLWDLKWEIARDGANLVFVDTIDTDSIRVTTKTNYKNKDYYMHFNKQSMRDYYKIMHAPWFAATQAAKAAALQSGKSFLEHLQAGQAEGSYPGTPQVDQRFIEIQKNKFNALIDYIYGQATLNATMEKYREIGLQEISYYDANGVFYEYEKLNGM